MKKVHPKTQTPLIATIISGFLAAVMATVFNLHQLIDMMSIGTLLAYTIVAICIVILHYELPEDNQNVSLNENKNPQFKMSLAIHQVFNIKFIDEPTAATSNVVKICVAVFCVLCLIFCGLLKFHFTILNIVFTSITSAALLLVVFIISRQPKDLTTELSFKVPLVPLLPCLSILINLYLMFQLDTATWIRFSVWIAIGKFN